MRHAQPSRARRGFSLPELLISMVMIAIIGIALTRLVVKESRFNNRQVLQRNARGVSRGALNVMTSELRMAEQSSAFRAFAQTTTSMTVRIPWAVGIACNNGTVAVMPVDSISQVTGYNNQWGVGVRNGTAGYDLYRASAGTTITTVGATALDCTTASLTTDWGSTNSMPAMTLYKVAGGLYVPPAAGTPVMFYYRVIYSLAASTSVPGRTGLFRQVGSGSNDELVAPFQSTSTFGYYVGTDRMPTDPAAITDWTTVSGVQLNLIGESEQNAQAQANPERANLSTAIFFRNRL